MRWDHSLWYISLEEPSFTLWMKICLMLTRLESFIYSQQTEAGTRPEGLWWFYLWTFLPDAGYLWQHLLGLGSFLLSWLHMWHVWNDTTDATALKSSCPCVMQNLRASSQPYKSAGFNQSGTHLMQSQFCSQWKMEQTGCHQAPLGQPCSFGWEYFYFGW